MSEALDLMAQMQRGCEELTSLLAQAQLNGDGALGQMTRARNLVRTASTEGDEEGPAEAPSQIPAALERARRASGKESPILADLRAALRKELLATEQLRKELEQEREARVAAERQLRELRETMGGSAGGASSPTTVNAMNDPVDLPAAASVGSFKLLHSIMPKSPEGGGKSAASANAAGLAAGIDTVSSSSSAASVE